MTKKSVVTLAQAHTELQLAPAQQMSPSDWDLTSKSLKILKPFVEVTKEAEGDHALLSEVIPMVNMLKSEINRNKRNRDWYIKIRSPGSVKQILC